MFNCSDSNYLKKNSSNVLWRSDMQYQDNMKNRREEFEIYCYKVLTLYDKYSYNNTI